MNVEICILGKQEELLSTRPKERKAACRLEAFERSAVAEHAWQPGHAIDREKVEVIDTAKDERMRKVKEALYIRLSPLKAW